MTKLGTVPHINAKPIIYPLENGLVEHQFDISYCNPALLSGKLYNREVDMGLIPVAEFLRVGNYRVFPDISISSYGSVDSVALLVKGKLKDISAVAVDSCSRSSTALLRIMLEIFYGLAPEYVRRDYGPGFYDEVDASMVFGDVGLRVMYDRPEGYTIYDLGKVWTDHTGLPFVYAVFALHEGVDLGENSKALLDSKSRGMEYIDRISHEEAEKLGISEKFCRNYLAKRIRYDLTDQDIAGLIKYSEYLSELGYCRSISNLSFYSV